MVFIPQLVGDGLQTIEGVAELSLIQGVIPDRILGRVNATLEVFSHGIAYPLGALLAAALAELIGVRGGIFVGWAGMAVSILLLVFSPLPQDPPGLGRAGPGELIATDARNVGACRPAQVRHDRRMNVVVACRCACPERVSDLLRACASERRGAPTA